MSGGDATAKDVLPVVNVSLALFFVCRLEMIGGHGYEAGGHHY